MEPVKCECKHYGKWAGTTPTISSVLTPLDEDNLTLAAQIGITDVVYVVDHLILDSFH